MKYSFIRSFIHPPTHPSIDPCILLFSAYFCDASYLPGIVKGLEIKRNKVEPRASKTGL